jgi:hypothetical protein
VAGDTLFEPDEQFTVTLSDPTGAAIDPSFASAIGTIRNDDLPVVPTPDDTLTGTPGPDVFGFRFGDSGADAPDRITDFHFGEDRIALLTPDASQLRPAPLAFSRAADNSTAANLRQLAQAVFADADGLTPGNQPLAANAAALVRSTNPAIAGTYLLINNPNPVFNLNNDLVINISGFKGSLPALGPNPVNSVFS